MARLIPAALIIFLGLVNAVSSQAENLLQAQQDAMQPKRVLYDKRNSDGRYQLPLGAIERIDGLWQPETSRVLQGKLRQRTLEFDTDKLLKPLFSYYQNLALKAGAQKLFSCEGRDCGRSNNWANGFFRIPQLYGREDSQRLASYWLQQGNQQQYLTLYMVRRGNQRIYLQQDLISFEGAPVDTQVPSLEALQQSLLQNGFIRLNQANLGLRQGSRGLEIAPAWFEVLVAVLNNQPRSMVATAHVYLADAEASKIASQALLERFQAQLKQRAVSTAVQLKAVGNIAPLATRPEQARLELMFQ